MVNGGGGGGDLCWWMIHGRQFSIRTAPFLSTTMQTRRRKRARKGSTSQEQAPKPLPGAGGGYSILFTRGTVFCATPYCTLRVGVRANGTGQFFRQPPSNKLAPNSKTTYLQRLSKATRLPKSGLDSLRPPTTPRSQSRLQPLSTTQTRQPLTLQSLRALNKRGARHARKTSSADPPWTSVLTGRLLNGSVRPPRPPKQLRNSKMSARRQRKSNVLTSASQAWHVSPIWRRRESSAIVKRTRFSIRPTRGAHMSNHLTQVGPELSTCMMASLKKVYLGKANRSSRTTRHRAPRKAHLGKKRMTKAH